MGYKDWPYWLMYGLIALIFPVIALIIARDFNKLDMAIIFLFPLYLGALAALIIVTILQNLFNFNLPHVLYNFVFHIINFLVYFYLGASVGYWIEHREKNRNQSLQT